MIFDHIASIIVFGALVLLLVSTQLRAQQASTEQTIAYMARKQSLNMAEIFEQEIALLGSGTAQTITSVEENEAGETISFVFWREDDGGDDIEVEYLLEESEVVQIKGDDVQLYEFTRKEDGVVNGGGSSTVRSLRIEPLNASGTITSPENARLIRIILVNAYPMGNRDDMYLHETYWGITLRPAGLE